MLASNLLREWILINLLTKIFLGYKIYFELSVSKLQVATRTTHQFPGLDVSILPMVVTVSYNANGFSTNSIGVPATAQTAALW